MFFSVFLSYAQGQRQDFDSLKASTDAYYHSANSKKDNLLGLGQTQAGQVQRLNTSLDSIQHGYRIKIDSLKNLHQPDTALINKLAKAGTKIDSLKQALSGLGNVGMPGEGLDKIQSNINDITGKAQNPINEKISLFQENGAEGLSTLNLPGLSASQLPNAEWQGLSLPGTSLGVVDLPANGLLSTDLNLPELKNISPGELGSIGGDAQKLGELGGQVGSYQQDLQQLSPGQLKDAPEMLENEASKLDQFAGLQEQFSEADKLKRYYDPEVAKEDMLNKAKQEAVNHFAGHEEELKAAMEQLSKLKAKIPDAEGVLDLFAKRQPFMQGRPWTDRLVPGLTFQVQKQQSLWLDLNPQLGFKVARRWTAGIGWNQRLAYDTRQYKWDSKRHIYGPRSFVHFKLKENVLLKADVETMHAPIYATRLVDSKILSHGWIWGLQAGVKKEFQFSKHIKANVQMLYALYSTPNRAPYAARFNVRLGFEMPELKGKQRKKDAIK